MKCFATCALVMILSLPVFGQGKVLCIGADGHVVVESASNGKCCDSPSWAATGGAFAVTLPPAEFSDCGVCVDVLVDSDAKAARMAREASSTARLVLPALIALNDASPISSRLALHPPLHRGCTNTPLAHLRTVSLLV